jgi:hypothetical protein
MPKHTKTILNLPEDRKTALINKLISGGESELKKLKQKQDAGKKDLDEVIILLGFDSLLSQVSSEYKNILQKLRATFPEFFARGLDNKKIKKHKELDLFVRQGVYSFLNQKSLDLSSRISRLRKKGKPLEGIYFDVMFLSSKLKLLKGDFDIKLLELILEKYTFCDTEIKKIEATLS